MKKRIALLFALVSFITLQANDVIVKINVADFTGEGVSLDGLRVDNMTNGSFLAFINLSDNVAEYQLNLNTGFLSTTNTAIAYNETLPTDMYIVNTTDASSKLIVHLDKADKTIINIYDMSGRQIVSQSLNLLKGRNEILLHTNMPGNYIASIATENFKKSVTFNSIESGGTNSIDFLSHTATKSLLMKSNNKLQLKSYTANDFKYTPGDLIRIIGLKEGMVAGSIYDRPVNGKEYELEFKEDIYLVKSHVVESERPWFVNVLFSVEDKDSIGVENLEATDFIVKEDGKAISSSESFLYIKKNVAKIKTVILLDNSYSVLELLPQIKQAAKQLIREGKEEQVFALGYFSEEATFLKFDNEDFFTGDTVQLFSAIESVDVGGRSTNLYGSVSEAVELCEDIYSLDNVEKGFVVVFTDGADTRDLITLQETIENIGEQRTFMVGLGEDIDPTALNAMANPGKYYPVSDANALKEVFVNIQYDIWRQCNSFYWFCYSTPKRENEHVVSLQIEGNSNTGDDAGFEASYSADGFEGVKKGVYVNIDDQHLYGVDSVYLWPNREYTFKPLSFWPFDAPGYKWIYNDAELNVKSINRFNSSITLDAKVDYVKTKLTIKDTVNNVENDVLIQTGGTVKDIEGNVYRTEIIGNQVWMAENLKVAKYADGTQIPPVTGDAAWAALGDNNTDKAYCWYNDDIANKEVYGALYTYAAATNGTPHNGADHVQGVCPTGWHLPSDAEWKQLEMHLGMSQTEADDTGWRGTTEGTKLKATSGWNSNGNGTDDNGFSAFPSGIRNMFSGSFYDTGEAGHWWSSTDYNSYNAYGRYLDYDRTYVGRRTYGMSGGLSVRCVRD